jgi:hypothetical protein
MQEQEVLGSSRSKKKKKKKREKGKKRLGGSSGIGESMSEEQK